MRSDLRALSPVEELSDPLFIDKRVRVFVKRDDMIHPFISGNKWRKLKYHLEEARAAQKSHLVTFGGAWSNHLLATACAGAKYHFQTTGLVRGETVNNPVLSLCLIFGMSIRFIDRGAYRDKVKAFDTYFQDDPSAYFIDEGGAGEAAKRGCAELITELDDEYSDICCAAGTGTTAAGISRGLAASSTPATLHVFPVLKGGEYLRAEIEKESHSAVKLHPGYHFGGYAKTNAELTGFIRNFSSSTGILIEPVYTGKLFYGVYDLIRSDAFKPGSKILVVHTGGLTGLLGMMDRF